MDPGQIEQVLVNLAVNARDAMPQGGSLTIRTAGRRDGPTDAEWVELAVSDTGSGIPEEVRAKIFEPFFTTKAEGKGTGLGLSTVHGIVRQHGGEIEVESEVGRGTTFRVLLPATLADARATEDVPREKEIPRGQETVLVVEDEPSVRQLLAETLGSLGYGVLLAASADEARRLLESGTESISVILTDVVMPGSSPRSLAAYVQASHPETTIVYMTGYTDDTIVHHGVLESGILLIRKPFTIRDVAETLRRALDVRSSEVRLPPAAIDLSSHVDP